MKSSPVLLSLALVLAGCSKKDSATAAADTNTTSSGNPLTAPVDYLGAIVRAKQASEKIADSIPLSQSVQLFYAQEDRFPKDLGELVTKRYIARIPPAPPGTKWTYNPRTGEVKTVPQEAAQ